MKRRYGQFNNAVRMANFKSDEERRPYSVIADPIRRAGFIVLPEPQRHSFCKALFTVNPSTVPGDISTAKYCSTCTATQNHNGMIAWCENGHVFNLAKDDSRYSEI